MAAEYGDREIILANFQVGLVIDQCFVLNGILSFGMFYRASLELTILMNV